VRRSLSEDVCPPGALHHIIIRGIERKAIFKDTAYRENFFERFGHIISETETGCYAWVYMTNYIHLLLKTGLAPIATVMRRLLTGYAVSYSGRGVVKIHWGLG